jgi:hypothetical protein
MGIQLRGILADTLTPTIQTQKLVQCHSNVPKRLIIFTEHLSLLNFNTALVSVPKFITYKQGQLVLDDATQERIDTLLPSATACEFQLNLTSR